MTIHETAAKLAAVNARIAALAQRSNDECIRLAARIQELEGALRGLIYLGYGTLSGGASSNSKITFPAALSHAHNILAKGN